MHRRAFLLSLLVSACAATEIASPPAPLVYYGASAGYRTLDEGEGGGNPFASALIETLASPPAELSDFGAALKERTFAKSNGFQVAEIPVAPIGRWPAPDARRVALVAVMSVYETANSLPGARRDAERVASALRGAGFDTRVVIDADNASLRAALTDFAGESSSADHAILYTTGHGLERDGRVQLLFGDYPVDDGAAGLAEHAIPLSEMAAAAQARALNLVFYAGCRDDPFAD